MLITATLLILLLRFPYIISNPRTCRPNSQILVNGKVCKCNNDGQWTETNCNLIQRRQICQPGQVVFQGCSRCVCEQNGQFHCTEENCPKNPPYQNVLESLSLVLPWCNPFRTYYINCNICVCPASGRTVEAHCALDISCTIVREPSTVEISSKKNNCIPNVMYLFPCLHCLCSDEGYFNLNKCVETCAKNSHSIANPGRRCIPKTLYRKGCNICRCPESSFPDDNLCTNDTCTPHASFKYLRSIKSKAYRCIPHTFTKPRCVYCDCNRDGTIDEKACLEMNCLKADELKYDIVRESCSPGEMVPVCIECLCPRSGMTIDGFCSISCSVQTKLKVLEKIVLTGKSDHLLDSEVIKKNAAVDTCEPNSVYIDKGRYCICPDTGNTNFNLCTEEMDTTTDKPSKTDESKVIIDFNVTCEPSSFVDFDCNVCFCSKKGKIDPKWCTYDDCEAKRIIEDSHKNLPTSAPLTEQPQMSTGCNPGSISKYECNFCICPENGILEDRVCTKNDCASYPHSTIDDKFACEPLAYYEVDCNICFCPRDGLKNVARCTKNHCEKGFLRSDVCVSGHLFSNECNVCVCAPNGNKGESVCTNYTCTDTAPWKKIFQLSETLLGNQIAEDATRHLDLCFPGEEYLIGCKLCVCPDMGLRTYATCSPTFCDEDSNDRNDIAGTNRGILLPRVVATRRESCMIVNFTNMYTRQECTPGSMYVIRCQECICPYMGNINHFCRPFPSDRYCEQAFPSFNYVPMGRREVEGNNNTPFANVSTANTTQVLHEHTRYECDKPGKIMDECFICECENNTVIAEHCFRNEKEDCKKSTPSFLKIDKI